MATLRKEKLLPLDDINFRPSMKGGLILRRDQEKHRVLMEGAERRLRDGREWIIPNPDDLSGDYPFLLTADHPNGIFADHISDDMGCLRKAVFNHQQGQKNFDRYGEMPLGDLDDRDIVFFGNGYAWQWNILGIDTEENTWNEEGQFWHSADGVFGQTYVEAKQTRKSALKKDDRIAGLSIEDVLMRDHQAWWDHMLIAMKLYGHRVHYLTINWVLPGDAETFRIDATDEEVQAKWDWLEERRNRRREYERLNTLPGIDTRMRGADECTYCPFLGKEPCLTEVGMEKR